MPLKKSAVFSLLLFTASVGALTITSYRSADIPAENGEELPAPLKCSNHYNNSGNAPLPWNIVSGNLFQREV